MSREKVKSAIKDKEINSLFNAMLGEGTVPPSISYKKYGEIRLNLNSMLTLLENFCKGAFVRDHAEYEMSIAEIMVFCRRSRAEVAEKMPEPPFSEIDALLNKVSPQVAAQFSDTYRGAKDMEVIRTCVKTCNNLVKYREKITQKDGDGKAAPDGRFIRGMPGAVFAPLPFTSLNLKEVFVRADIDDKYRKYIMTVLAMVFEYTYALYNIYTSPDWDPDQFTELMKHNIAAVRKQIPRCDKAFDKIEASLGLLKNNMDGYYKDFVSTKNPSIMMESFVMDVANDNQGTDPKTAQQFRTILQRYKAMAKGKPLPPQMKALLDKMSGIAGDTLSADRGGDQGADNDDAGADKA